MTATAIDATINLIDYLLDSIYEDLVEPAVAGWNNFNFFGNTNVFADNGTYEQSTGALPSSAD